LIPSRPEDEGYVARYEGADRSRIPASIAIDEISGLASAPASATIEAIEAAARSKGHTLAIDGTTDRSTTLRAWLDAGTPGAIETWTDPVDHVVAGVLSTLPDGRLLEVRGCPRRASGPDLMALSIGARGRFGAIEGATLRTHRLDADRATTSKTSFDRDPKPNDGEAALAGHLEAALRRSS
jgi:alkyldihydroxyacetonephosphate synthase